MEVATENKRCSASSELIRRGRAICTPQVKNAASSKKSPKKHVPDTDKHSKKQMFTTETSTIKHSCTQINPLHPNKLIKSAAYNKAFTMEHDSSKS